jgi:hypothetical protein
MEEKKLIDDCFYVEQQSWGTWKSFDKEGKPLVTSLTEDALVSATRAFNKWNQEGFTEFKTYSSTVEGKL